MPRFYRIVTEPDPPLRDFRSHADRGHVFPDLELQHRAEEVSIWDDLARVRQLARGKPWLDRHVAILEIPSGVELHPGRRGHWGIRGARPEQIKGWVVEVVPL